MPLTLACSPQAGLEDGETEIALATVARFQTGNLSTDIVSLPEGLGLAAIDYGWQRRGDPASSAGWLTVSGKAGRLRIFSADGDLEEMELELSLAQAEQGQRVPVQIRLNNQRLDRVFSTSQWTSHTIPIPAEIVREGVNILTVAPRTGNRQTTRSTDPQLRLRRARFRSTTDRVVWPDRPSTIGTDDGIEMPVASFFDLVVRVPVEARLLGGCEFHAPQGPAAPAYAYIQILDESQSERTLFHRRFFRSSHRQEDLDLDLSPWSGQLVRLRVGTTGERNGVVHWQGLKLTAPAPLLSPLVLPPIEPQIPPTSGRLGRPDVLVVLLDAARADAFSPWGGPHPTPAAERLARDGTVFSNALSPAPWTGQAVPSILTGLFPDSLGVGSWGSRLPVSVPTLAELMAAAGYRTVLWSQHPFYSNHDTFRRGFEEFYRGPKGDYQALPSAETLMTSDRPTFSFVHLIPPHAPYEPPPPFRGAHSSWYAGEMSVDAKYLNSFPRRQEAGSLTEDDVRYSMDRYLENAAFADHLFEQILATLDQNGRYDDTLIVLLSDHGEAFMEHGRFLHTTSVHREFLHVPLVVKWPVSVESANTIIEPTRSLVDLVPTLVDGLGLDPGSQGFQGRSLLPSVFNDPNSTHPVYAMTRGGHDPERAPKTALMLESDGWRILFDPNENATHLYRSDTDPRETEDLSSDNPLLSLLLKQAVVSQWLSNRELVEPGETNEPLEVLDAEVMEQLEALGYLD